MSAERVTFDAESGGYYVLLNGERIGRVWKKAGRSFSGAWVGVHASGGSAGSFNQTRKEAVENILWIERRRQEGP